ncbi:uncharacterized protein LOC143028591 [Oratosquilla oratoria]|uniref:uncharacterized protein LOC143028591 n=1 Tax=Oratosquilla oratoria TaxID=337810 RepID=UPI003F75C39A
MMVGSRILLSWAVTILLISSAFVSALPSQQIPQQVDQEEADQEEADQWPIDQRTCDTPGLVPSYESPCYGDYCLGMSYLVRCHPSNATCLCCVQEYGDYLCMI